MNNTLEEKIERYYNFIDSIDFSTLRIEEVSFYRFKREKTKILMGRLQHYYEHVLSQPARPYNTESLDILLVNTAFGKLVILYIVPDEFKSLSLRGCTLTEFKRDEYHHLFSETTCKERPLYKKTSCGEFHSWERPYELRAHTEADEDYGNIWNGDTLVHEGNKYGDTSKFCIVGYINN